MFDDDAKIIKRMTPLLKRVLIVDPQPASARFVGELMRNLARSDIWVADSTEKGVKMASRYDPHIIFVEGDSGAVNGVEFTKQLRKSISEARYTPVIMVTSQATAAGILAARDAGVHEFLRKPFTMRDLLRRLEAVTLRKRDWVEAVGYIGPDRRRFNSGDYTGALKRRSDAGEPTDASRIVQALKILRSSIGALDTDPQQAMRSMIAQAADIQKAGMAVADMKLTSVAIDFGKFLSELAQTAPPYNGEQILQQAAKLLAYMPAGEVDKAFAA